VLTVCGCAPHQLGYYGYKEQQALKEALLLRQQELEQSECQNLLPVWMGLPISDTLDASIWCGQMGYGGCGWCQWCELRQRLWAADFPVVAGSVV
jgi:hypothetical protein